MTPEVQRRLLERLLPGWDQGQEVRGEHKVGCPLHDDQHPSFRIKTSELTWFCDPCGFGGGVWDLALRMHGEAGAREILESVSLPTRRDSGATVRPPQRNPATTGSSRSHPPVGPDATVRPTPDLTLAAYAEAKKLPTEFLIKLGIREVAYQHGTALRIPYLDETGEETAIRYRLCLEKGEEADGRFRWRTGSKPTLYGLQRLSIAQAASAVVLAEGESDTQTCWLHGIPALGVPGCGNWKPEWADALDGISTIFAIREPDRGGETFVNKLLATDTIRDRLRIVDLPTKDISELYLQEGESFERVFGEHLDRSAVVVEVEREKEVQAGRELWERCEDLAREPWILDRVAEALGGQHVVGEKRIGKITYLALTSRLLEQPVSTVVKGLSAAGKSFELQQTLRLFPSSAYISFTSMSERSLIYSVEPLAHRMLVVYEAAALENDFILYLLRTLLSEGHIAYETVEKVDGRLQTRRIEREGPTGILLTTTSIELEEQFETRLLTVSVDDSSEQTRRVFRALADESEANVELDEWQALQEWLEVAGEHRVVISFARALADLVPPVAVRLRRDFGMLLNLIRSHAVLHQANRDRDEHGRIVATLDDYAVTRDLVGDLIGDVVGSVISVSIRSTVQAVETFLTGRDDASMSTGELADKLGIDRKAAWRRARVALDRGYLRNLEDRKHRPHKLVLGEPMPEERDLLPDPALLSDGSPGQLSSHPHSGPLTGREDSGNGEWSQGHTDSEEVSENTHSEREEFVV